MGIPVTALYAALLGLLAIGLAARVVILRRRLRVGVGDGGHETMALAIRAHANLVEYAPLALLLLLVLEFSGARDALLHALGVALLAGRLLHAWGLSHKTGISFGRFYGTALTWAMIVVAAGGLLLKSLMG